MHKREIGPWKTRTLLKLLILLGIENKALMMFVRRNPGAVIHMNHAAVVLLHLTGHL